MEKVSRQLTYRLQAERGLGCRHKAGKLAEMVFKGISQNELHYRVSLEEKKKS